MLGSEPSKMTRQKRQTITLLLTAFVVGTAVAYPILRSAESHRPTNFDWLLWPGFIVSVPVYVLGGGVHGSGVDIWAWAVVPCNGIGYALVTGLVLWISRKFSGKRGRIAPR